MLLGGLIVASMTGTARAQDPIPPARREIRETEWEYRYYFCAENDPCAADHAKAAYEELDELGHHGWEAYAYSGAKGTGFNWELKRRL